MSTNDLQMAIHAQMMANLCTAPYAQLILQVMTRHPNTGDVHRQLIAMISYGSQMSRICGTANSHEMIYTVTEKLFNSATISSYAFQDEATRLIIAMVAHATSMARIVSDGAAEIYGTVRPIVDDIMPVNAQDLDRLKERLESARNQISDISHRVQMERLARSIARR